MITVLKQGTSQAQMEHLIAWLKEQNLDVHVSHGQDYTILGLIGDTSKIDMELLGSLDIVESVKRALKSDATVIRLYECFGQRARVRLTLADAPKAVKAVSLMEASAIMAISSSANMMTSGNGVSR